MTPIATPVVGGSTGTVGGLLAMAPRCKPHACGAAGRRCEAAGPELYVGMSTHRQTTITQAPLRGDVLPIFLQTRWAPWAWQGANR